MPVNPEKDTETNPFDGEYDPPEREQLPWLKDPGAGVSVWAIIKDSIGKDIT